NAREDPAATSKGKESWSATSPENPVKHACGRISSERLKRLMRQCGTRPRLSVEHVRSALDESARRNARNLIRVSTIQPGTRRAHRCQAPIGSRTRDGAARPR